ncbi:MAG UNVERIFIED_CONTAM: alpha/beta fold hydrolase [Anaerolineae bacterium]
MGANIPLMLPLAQQLYPLGYRIHLLDLPGFGESGLPPQAWSVHDYARHVLAYMAYQNLERVHLFGHSFGGASASSWVPITGFTLARLFYAMQLGLSHVKHGITTFCSAFTAGSSTFCPIIHW